MNKKEITVKVDDNEQVVVVKKPNHAATSQSKVHAAAYIAELMRSGERPLTRDEINEINRMTPEEEKEYSKISREIVEGEDQLKRGGRTKDGRKFTKKQAKELAIRMRTLRDAQLKMLMRNSSLYEHSLESIKEDRAFDYLVSCCCFDEEGNRIFNNLNDYLNKADNDYAKECAKALSEIMYPKDTSWYNELSENEFLIKYGFANEDGDLLNEEGKTILEVLDEKEEVEFVEFADEDDEEEEEQEKEESEETPESE